MKRKVRYRPKKEAEALKTPRRFGLASRIICCVLTYVLLIGILAYDLSARQVALSAGDIATETIKATREVVDQVTTETMQQDAMNAVGKVSVRDDAIAQQVQTDLESCYQNIEDMRTLAQQDYANWQSAQVGTDSSATYDYSQSLLEQCKKVLPFFNETELRAMLDAKDAQLEKLFQDINEQVTKAMEEDISENAVAQQVSAISEALANSTNVYSSELLSIGNSIVSQYMRANTVYSEELTEVARNKARDGVEPVVYKTGQNIVREGETVTQAQIAILEELGILQQNSGVLSLRLAGAVLITGIILLCMWLYLALFEQETFGSMRMVILINTVVLLTVLTCWLTENLNIYLIPSVMGAMLIAVLVEHRIAVVCNFALAGLAGLLAVIDQSGNFANMALPVTLATLTAGCVAVYVVYRNPQRTTILISGLAAGVINLLMFAGADFIASASGEVVLHDAVMGMMAGLLAAVICLGTLPIWEWVFQIVTPMKLLEISNPNHPLLKRLLVEASGTYHHSIVVGNLAESAAQAIGANALLTRTGAYYHDVGKLKRPYFFKENQGNENPHDHIDPQLSAKIIRAHPTDGYELAREYKVPAPILNIIREHHGDSKIAYFYHKAKQMAPEGTVIDENNFRYPGPLPQTREAAVIMLADTVEAAVRSLKDHSSEKIDEMITRLVHAKLNEGQLRHCALTLSDLDIITVTFRNILSGVYHERIEYPDQDI